MPKKLDRIEAEALQLGPKSRATLAERLLRSLEPPHRPRSESEWLDEAERRDREVDRGAATIPARGLLRHLRSEIARKRRPR